MDDKACILLVESNLEVVSAVRAQLERTDYRVEVAYSADAAENRIRSTLPDAALVGVSGLDGESLCARLKEIDPSFAVGLISPLDDDSLDWRAESAGADGCIAGVLSGANLDSFVRGLVRTTALRRRLAAYESNREVEVEVEIPDRKQRPASLKEAAPIQGASAGGFDFFRRLLLVEVQRSKRYKYPLAFLLAAVILALVARWLGVTPDAWAVARYICKLLALVGVGWFLVRLVDVAALRVRDAALEKGGVGLGFLPMTVWVAKAVAVVLIGLAAMDVVGINVIAGLGALGIGAAAIAFAAQKTLENLFGTFSIASDRPFEVGDYVSVGQDMGNVENVGFRSTRIRTLGRTLVTVPNGVVAAGRVENYSARDRIMYNPVLRLAYATTVEQLRLVIDELGRLLRSHPKVFQGEQRVRFAALGENSLNVEVWCWVATKKFLEYTEVVEELNFGIVGIVERSGTSFAFPTRALFMAKDGVIDLERELRHESETRRERGDAAGSSPAPAGHGENPPGPSDKA